MIKYKLVITTNENEFDMLTMQKDFFVCEPDSQLYELSRKIPTAFSLFLSYCENLNPDTQTYT